MDTEMFTPPLYEGSRNKAAETTTEMRLRNYLKYHDSKDLYQANPLNEEEYRRMRALFRPVFLLMALQGLFHPSRKATSEETPEEYRYSRWYRWLTMALSLCNICYLSANWVVLVVAKPNVDMRSFTVNVYIIMLVWLSTAVILAALQFLICERPNRYDKIWEKWAYWARHPRKRNWRRLQTIRNIYIALAIAVAVTPAVIAAVANSQSKPGSGLERLLQPVSHGSLMVNHYWWTVNFCTLTFSIFGTVSFTTVFFVTHCLILADELKALFHVIADHLETGRIWDVVNDGDEEISILEQLRRRRLECRDIVEAVDGAFEESAFLSIFANVPLIVFVAYGLVSYEDQSAFKKAMGVIAILGSLLQVMVVSISAAWVHEWAAAPKKTLHTLKVHNYLKITRTNTLSLQLFLSELTSESIGITAWAFAVITKEFIATVIGLAVSYIIVLVEFRHMREVLQVTNLISDKLNNVTMLQAASAGSDADAGSI